LLPRSFTSSWWGRHYRAADSTKAIVDGASVLFDVIVTAQVERFAHALNVAFGKKTDEYPLENSSVSSSFLTFIGLYVRGARASRL